MMKKKPLFISCDEAKHICDKAQYDEASFWEKIKLGIRLSWCSVTKKYNKRNVKLSNILESTETECLSPKEKKDMELKFKEELTKHNK